MQILKEKLPVDEFLNEITTICKKNKNCVVVAEPGAGKTTRIPVAILENSQGKVIVLEPRRIAAVSAAYRICEENNFTIGQEVGYQVRFENTCSENTRLIFMTEALLNRHLLNDPQLHGVDFIILDEFHERSHHVDLALGFIYELQQLGHPIKLIIMSATIDAEKISQFLDNAPIIQVPGKLFPLKIELQKNSQLLVTNHQFYQQLELIIQKALQISKHDILVFLPGVGEIQRMYERLAHLYSKHDISIFQLHGRLQLSEQKRALQKTSSPKIILTTNIAESAVTVDGVDCVIDTGLEKTVVYDPQSGFQKMQLQRISLASAKQRSGRAARQYPGICLRMWNSLDEAVMPQNIPPEIFQIDLSDCLIFLAAQGITHFQKFSWYEKPSEINIQRATERLIDLNILNKQNELTELGKLLLQFPVSIRYGLILIRGLLTDEINLAARIAAVLQERDFVTEIDRQHAYSQKMECDLSLRIQAYQSKKYQSTQVAKTEQQYSAIAKRLTHHPFILKMQTERLSIVNAIQDIIVFAFRDRLCRRRSQTDRGLMSNGKGVQINQQSIVQESEFFIALDVFNQDKADSQVSLAVGLNKKQVETLFQEQIQQTEIIELNNENSQFYKKVFPMIGKIKLHDGQVTKATSNEISAQLPKILISMIDELEKRNSSFQAFMQQLRFLDHHLQLCPQEIRNRIDFIYNQKHLTDSFLTDFCDNICFGESNIENIFNKDLRYFIEQAIGDDFYFFLKSEIPTHIQVPTERWVPVEYNSEWMPSLNVRLQECFGMKQNPKIFNQQITVALQLLAPNQRPVQITSDISGFWQKSYFDVRKELKSRYPKHEWPDDPANAKPTKKTKQNTNRD